MSSTFIEQMGRRGGNSGKELGITKYCKTKLSAQSHIVMREIEPVFQRNGNISLRTTWGFDYNFSQLMVIWGEYPY